MVAMRYDSVIERSRGLRGASMVVKASRRLHEVFVVASGGTMVASRNLIRALVPPAIRQIMIGLEEVLASISNAPTHVSLSPLPPQSSFKYQGV